MNVKMDAVPTGANLLTFWIALNIALFLPHSTIKRQAIADAA